MTIANELQLLQTNLTASYSSCNNKGATMPVNQNFSNLASCIDTIPTGGGSPDLFGILFKGEIDANGVYTLPYDLTYTGNVSFNGVKSLNTFSSASGGAFASYLYHQASQVPRLKCKKIVGVVSFPDLETALCISAFQAFCNGQTITGISFPKLTTINGADAFRYICQKCASLTSIDFSELTSITGNYCFSSGFEDCISLTSVSFPKLTSISGNNVFQYAFRRCTNLTNMYFNAVTTSNASAIKSGLGSSMLNNVSNCKVHFPSNVESIIGAYAFGGSGNTGTVFDLPATE